MRPLAILALALPFGGPSPTPQAAPVRAGWERMRFGDLVIDVGPLDKSVGLVSASAKGPIAAYGGTGTVEVRMSVLHAREVDAVLRDVSAAEFLGAFADKVPELKRAKLSGRIPSVDIRIRGKRFTAVIRIAGGLMEFEGRLPTDG